MPGQLSAAFSTLSPSLSASQASPWPSPSVSRWSGLAMVGQLSQALPTPSPSPSAWSRLATKGQLSKPSDLPSPSASSVYDSVFPASVSREHRRQEQAP